MFSTGPVAAAGFSVSSAAGEWATITKLIRNSSIGLVAITYSFYHSAGSAGVTSASVRRIWANFPKFIVGFLLLIGIANSGVLTKAQITSLNSVSSTFFLLAFAGLGFEIRSSEIRLTGLQPFGLVFVYLLVISTLSFIAVSVLF